VNARTGLSFLLLLGLGACMGAPAQRDIPDEEAVRSLDDQEHVAILKQDQPALERLFSDQVVVNAPSNQVAIGKRAVLALIQAAPRSSFEHNVEFIRVDGDIAIIMGAETLQPIGDAPRAGQTVQRRFTNIWRKEAGTWRLLARHSNVIAPR
jgi:ketosteroid isomerase-like protein